MLVLTYRDDEVGRDHPLQRVLGVLGGASVHRLSLRRLTSESVGRSSPRDTTVDAVDLHRMTGGNPFFVTEVLASPATAVPQTVVDAVLARVRGLSPAARATLDQLAVVPGPGRVGTALEPDRRRRPDRRGRTGRGSGGRDRRGGVPARAGPSGRGGFAARGRQHAAARRAC